MMYLKKGDSFNKVVTVLRLLKIGKLSVDLIKITTLILLVGIIPEYIYERYL